jgi:hypothetical protein
VIVQDSFVGFAKHYAIDFPVQHLDEPFSTISTHANLLAFHSLSASPATDLPYLFAFLRLTFGPSLLTSPILLAASPTKTLLASSSYLSTHESLASLIYLPDTNHP